MHVYVLPSACLRNQALSAEVTGLLQEAHSTAVRQHLLHGRLNEGRKTYYLGTCNRSRVIKSVDCYSLRNENVLNNFKENLVNRNTTNRLDSKSCL